MNSISKLNIDDVEYIFGKSGINTDDATALASDILLGKTAYARGFKLEGTIPFLNSKTIIPNSTNQLISHGSYLNEDIIIKGSENLIQDNIKLGVDIFGIIGSLVPYEILLAGWHNGSQQVIYWNGESYTQKITSSAQYLSFNFSGKPKKAVFFSRGMSGNDWVTISGINLASINTMKEYNEEDLKNNSVESNGIGTSCAYIILGVK